MANSVLNAKDNFKVVIKSRPLIKRERDMRLPSQWKIDGDSIECNNPLLTQRYTFDHIYGEGSTTQELYDQVSRPIVTKSVQGFNGTIFAYGQTSSGKTYTMLGDKKNPGIIRLAARQIFSDIMLQQDRSFIVRVNYLEIYNEKVYDLLNDRKEIKIQELPSGDLRFGCTGQNVQFEDDILRLVDAGNNHRKVAETNMNVQSSRSHAILQIGIESILECDGASQVSVLNLVDLAGSERADSTGATGERLKEAGNINKSLLTLSLVINKLSEDPDGHICYRDSKLTRMLQTSLGGNSMTVMICAITPAALDETNLTLGFATRAKKIENKPVINETISDAIEVKRLKKTIVKLEEQVEFKSKEIDEYKKRANELSILKKMIIQAPKAPIPIAHRRKTWAPGNELPSNENLMDEIKNSNGRPMCHLMFGDQGVKVECTDNDWDSFMNDTIGRQIVDIDIDDTSPPPETLSFPSRPHQNTTPLVIRTANNPIARKSLLRTPKSLKNLLKKRVLTPEISTLVASPIALDKDRRIRCLEEELEELRHFQQTESLANIDVMKSEIAKNEVEINDLNEKLAEAQTQINSVKIELEAAQQESKEAKRERAMAVNAKKIAEQNMTGIEYEYEQHKIRANRREKELVEQLDNFGNNEDIKLLKEKLRNMTEKVNSLETQLWQDDKQHKAEIEKLNTKLLDEHENSKRIAEQANKFKHLQNEYDDVSLQLVDSIQDNDKLKKEYSVLMATVDKLNEEISEFKTQLSNGHSDLNAALQKLGQKYASEKEMLEQTNRLELQNFEEKQTAQVSEISKLKQIIDNQSMDIEKLNEKNEEIEDNEKQLKETISHQEKEILDLKLNFNGLLNDYKQLEHSHNLRDNICNQARMTVDCLMKEIEVLRHGYTELQMSQAEQELEHLKLQKTICEFDDTNNFSVFNETASISMVNHNLTNYNNGREKADTANEIEQKLQKVIEDCALEKETLEKTYRVQLKTLEDIQTAQLSEISELKKTNADHSIECRQLNEKHCQELQKITEDCALEKETLEKTYRIQLKTLEDLQTAQLSEISELKKINADHSIECKQLNEKHSQELQKNIEDCALEKETLEKTYRVQLKTLEDVQTAQLSEISQLKQINADHSIECNQLNEKHCQELQKVMKNCALEKETLEKTYRVQLRTLEEIQSVQLSEISKLKQINADHSIKFKQLNEKHCQELQKNIEDCALEKETLEKTYRVQLKTLEDIQAAQLSEISQLKKINADSIEYKQLNEKHCQELQKVIENCALEKETLEKTYRIQLKTLEDIQTAQLSEISQLKKINADQLIECKQSNEKHCQELQKAIENGALEKETLEKAYRVQLKTLEDKQAVQLSEMSQLKNINAGHSIEFKQLNEKHCKELQKIIEERDALASKLENAVKRLAEASDEEPRRNTTTVRKIKRQSIHDDTRPLPGFDSTMIDLGTQTDPTDEKCGCNEMAKQITKLKQEIIIIEAKYATFRMSTGVDELKEEIKKLKSDLSATKTKLNQCKQLNEKNCEELQKVVEERDALASKLENAVKRLAEASDEELRRNTTTVRKIKRQSIHDDTRRLSGFDSTMIDLGTQTDPTDEKCGCNEMAKQITKLKQEIIIIEAKYATFRMSTGVDELKEEIKKLRSDHLATKTKLNQVNEDYENILDKHEKLKVKSAMAQQKISTSDAFVQTESTKTNATFVDQVDWERVNRRVEKYKKGYEELVNKYNQLKDNYNQKSLELEEKSAKCIETSQLLDEIQPKYSNMKRICNHRWDKIEEFKKKLDEAEKNEIKMNENINEMKQELAKFKETSAEFAKVQRKYEMVKGICDSRRLEIERLTKLIGGKQNNENVPVNK